MGGVKLYSTYLYHHKLKFLILDHSPQCQSLEPLGFAFGSMDDHTSVYSLMGKWWLVYLWDWLLLSNWSLLSSRTHFEVSLYLYFFQQAQKLTNKLSHNPLEILARVFAEHGQTRITSAHLLNYQMRNNQVSTPNWLYELSQGNISCKVPPTSIWTMGSEILFQL